MTTRDDVIQGLRVVHGRIGRAPSAHELRRLREQDPTLPHPNTATRLFGSWNAALAAAELDERRHVWTRGEILDALRRLHAETGRIPAATDLSTSMARKRELTDRVERHARLGLPHLRTVNVAFGSLAEANAAAGLLDENPTPPDSAVG